MNKHRDIAVQLLDHYVTGVMTKAGMKVDTDTHMEIAQCVDEIINATCVEVQQRLLAAVREGKFRF